MDNPIEEFFYKEFNNNLDCISTALHEIDANGQFDNQIQVIMNGCMKIMDLGMVHGYDGVEAIAERMYSAARTCAASGVTSLDKSRKRLSDAMQTLRQVVELSEDSSAMPFVEETNSKMDFEIDNFQHTENSPEEEYDSLEEHDEPEGEKAESKPTGLFEIKEFTAVPKFPGHISDPGANDVEKQENAESIFEKESEYWDDGEFAYQTDEFDEAEIELIEHTLDDINMKKAVHDLDQIMEAIEVIKANGEDANLAIQDIKDSCSDLRVISEEEAMQPIAEIIYPMERIAAEKLQGNHAEVAVAILEECTSLLRGFLFDHELPLDKLTSIRTSLNTKLFAESRISPYEEFDIDDVREFEDELGEVHVIKTPLVSKLRKLFGMY